MSMVNSYINLYRDKHPGICEILDHLVARIEMLEEKVQTLEDQRAQEKKRRIAAAWAIARNAKRSAKKRRKS